MCRQGGYYDQAVFLARKHEEHEIVVDVLIEDSKKYDEALDYIWRLNPDLAYPNLMKYATVLLEHCPKDATQIFIDYYTGHYRPKKDLPLITSTTSQSGGGIGFSNITSYIPLAYRQGQSTPATVENQSNQGNGTEPSDAAQSEPLLEYDAPKPRTAFSAFVDHPNEFVEFLEACLKQQHIEEFDKVDLYTALFEMYLEVASRQAGSEKREWENKARNLINSSSVKNLSEPGEESETNVSRHQLTHRMSYFSPIFHHMKMELFWCASEKACVLTSSDLTHLPKTLLALSKL